MIELSKKNNIPHCDYHNARGVAYYIMLSYGFISEGIIRNRIGVDLRRLVSNNNIKFYNYVLPTKPIVCRILK